MNYLLKFMKIILRMIHLEIKMHKKKVNRKRKLFIVENLTMIWVPVLTIKIFQFLIK